MEANFKFVIEMKIIQSLGIALLVIAVAVFTIVPFLGEFKIDSQSLNTVLLEAEVLGNEEVTTLLRNALLKESSQSTLEVSSSISDVLSNYNSKYIATKEWGKLVHKSSSDLSFSLLKITATGSVVLNKGLWLFLTFGLGIIGALMYLLPQFKSLPGIKNDHIYQDVTTNRGWVAWVIFVWLVSFYVLLYFNAHLIVNWTFVLDPVKQFITGAENGASQWFVYGVLYCTVMIVMGIRMAMKYRHNNYQLVRTASVVFFQVVFAFLLVEILPLFNIPGVDLKNAWPLDYDFLFDWNVTGLLAQGNAGKFVFFWGIIFSFLIIPVMVYFFGKRWYCSWVCGCGGLAETLGDPYRQHSDKSLKAWKFERYSIHGVLLFSILMTAWTGVHTYRVVNIPDMASKEMFLWVSAFDIRSLYGFLIGSIFSGVIGTGFYPIFGNRVWCRFGCPLAAYMGFVQRFKSRFRITTNGGQCISCGNCSTYCEQGIDVRAYAQKGENIVRSSCVGCGICSAVCPRGVLKLENGPEEGRITEMPGIGK